ncbi:MAG: methyltransferase domain-containing protein [Eubacterium sp.]
MTINEQWEAIKQGQNVRQNLSILRLALRDEINAPVVKNTLFGESEKLIGLLAHDDPKTRKNTALLLGALGQPEFLAPLYDTYIKEEKLFVKSAYLTAMKNFDYSPYTTALKTRLTELTKQKTEPENEKHITEEIRELSALVIEAEGVWRHQFESFDAPYTLILTTNRNYPEMTKEALKKADASAKLSVFNAGVMAQVNHLRWVQSIRTYQEILFVVGGMQTCTMDVEQAAETIVHSQLLPFLKKAHQGEAPFYFRVELRSGMPLDKRSAFVKKLSTLIEKKSGRKFINTTSHYEFEIRLIETRDGKCNGLIKCHTLRDNRFAYREGVIPQSIKPVNAAVVVELAKAYLKKDAQIIDPFCGVGTMLIERQKAVAAKTAYGIDVMAETIEKARANTALADQTIHYINRDFFDFKHDYLFDEVITDMPFELGQKSEESIYALYLDFFAMVGRLLKPDAKMILYTHNKNYIQEMAEENGFKIVKSHEIGRREKTALVILERIPKICI